MSRNFRVLKLLAWVLLCIAQALWSLPSQAASRTVRAAIFPMGGFHSLENGQPVGYDVDYLEQVSRYTGWQIKFVNFDTWHAALNALEKNQIDLLGGALHTPERAGRFLYSSYASGITYTALVALKDTPLVYEDFKKFESLRIGVTSDSPWRADFTAYAAHNGFTAPKLIPFALAKDSRDALKAGTIDAILTSVISLEPDETVLAKYDPKPFFYIASRSNTQLMKELEHGIAQLKLEQPDLENKLARTHLWRSYQTPLTKAERDFVRSCPPLRVGYSPARKPLIWHDRNTDETRGILPGILRKLSRESGLIFQFVPMDDPDMNLNDYFRQGKIDLCAGVMYSTTCNSSPLYTLTSPVLRSGLNLYSKKISEIPPGVPLRVAIPAVWRGGRVYLNSNFPDLRVEPYPDIECCLEAVIAGKADLLLQTSFEVDYLLARPRFREIVPLQEYSGFEDNRLAVSVAMPPPLLNILNKLLMNVDEKSKSQIISENISAVASPMSLSDMTYEHRTVLAILGQMLLFALIFFACLAYLRRKSGRTAQESERRLTNMANNINGGVISLINNPRLDIRNANSGFWHLLGYNDTPPKNPCLADFLSSEESEKLFRLLESRREDNTSVNMELRLRRKNGQHIPALLRCTWSSDGQVTAVPCLDCVVVDITEQKHMQTELEQEKERYRILLEQSQDIIFDMDLEKRQFTCSPNFVTKFGRDSTPMFTPEGRPRNDQIVHPDDLPALTEMRRRVRSGERTVFSVMRIPTAQGRYIWCRVQTTRISKKDAPLHIVGKIVDIDEEVRRRAELERLSQRDSLTDLYNKVAFREKVMQNIPVRLKGDKTHALLFLDLDNFKELNDSLGHMAGDAALIDAADALRRIFRNVDAVGRFGGDEFCVFAMGITRNAMSARADSVLKALDMRFYRDGKTVNISASIGIYMLDGSETSYEEALQRADNAQYRAKQLGKNRCVFYDDPPPEPPETEQG
ncbi:MULTISPECIES: diguanylate cyclase [unclassified Desulfovibrio]|uniref:diguanylate cyclase n=1 Tax=unclassified Desulfovibrio TaxID=2593640 RepID=UPI002FD8F251